MGGIGKFDTSGLRKLQKELEKVKEESEGFQEHCAKKLAQGLITKVKKRTPVGDYSGKVYKCASDLSHKGVKVKGKEGGTLRRGWTAAPISRTRNITSIEVVNPIEYASYVENGHRTANHKGWVQGHFMLKKSADEVQAAAPKVIQKEMDKWLGGALK